MKKRVLIVEDDKNLRDSLSEYLETEEFWVTPASNGLSGQKILTEETFDAAVFDLKMDGMNGLELLNWIKNEGPEIPVIMMSAFGEVEDAVKAIKTGAKDYLVKPFDPEELVIRLRNCIKERNITNVMGDSREKSSSFIFSDRGAMKEIIRLVDKVAPTDSTVLITGESGTGKEVTARYIHSLSKRANGPFHPVNIGGIPENLLESEIFGYEKGAFTGAEKRKQGLFELAGNGTLFLDEIGDMPIHLQVKLLRVLQEKKINRLGGTVQIPIDVRLIAATNRNLEERIQSGDFREDLYYRLNVISIEMPPLRDRKGDVKLLTMHFIEKNRINMGLTRLDISEESINYLKRYDFPGNIRELENIIERAAILCEDHMIKPLDLNINYESGKTTGMNLKHVNDIGSNLSNNHSAVGRTLKDIEKEAVITALHRNEGKKGKAAEELGINRRTILNKINEYNLDRFRQKD